MRAILVALALLIATPAHGFDLFLLARARADMGKTARDLGLPQRLWCADWINRLTGGGTGSRAAKSYLKLRRVAPCTAGTVAVLRRGSGGHVGIVASCDRRGNPTLISGNHNGRVGAAAYPRNRVIAWVQP